MSPQDGKWYSFAFGKLGKPADRDSFWFTVITVLFIAATITLFLVGFIGFTGQIAWIVTASAIVLRIIVWVADSWEKRFEDEPLVFKLVGLGSVVCLTFELLLFFNLFFDARLFAFVPILLLRLPSSAFLELLTTAYLIFTIAILLGVLFAVYLYYDYRSFKKETSYMLVAMPILLIGFGIFVVSFVLPFFNIFTGSFYGGLLQGDWSITYFSGQINYFSYIFEILFMSPIAMTMLAVMIVGSLAIIIAQVQGGVGDTMASIGYLAFVAAPMLIVFSILVGAVPAPQPLIDIVGGRGTAQLIFFFAEGSVYVVMAGVIMVFVATGRLFVEKTKV